MEQRVLIVEGDNEQRTLFAQWLAATGYQVQAVGDGAEALRLAVADPPQVVVVDTNIEDSALGAHQLCLQLKSHALTQTIPVVMITYQNRVTDILQGLEVGADHFLMKPFESEYFLNRLAQLFSGTSIAAAAAAAAAADVNQPLGRLIEIFNAVIWRQVVDIVGLPTLHLMIEQGQIRASFHGSYIQALTITETGLDATVALRLAAKYGGSQSEIATAFTTFTAVTLDILAKLTGDILIKGIRAEMLTRINR
jgi:CheY-like chemotaxis protein